MMEFKDQKKIKLMYLPMGVLSLSAGIGVSFIDLRLAAIGLGFILAGLLFLILFIIALKRKRTPSGSGFSRIKICLYLILLFLSLFLVNYLAYSRNIRIDVTQLKQHTLDLKTISTLSGLRENVKITVFYVGISPKYLEDLLKSFSENGQGYVKTEIIDPIVDIGYAAQFGNVVNGKEKKAIVEMGKNRRDVDFTDEALSEEMLVNAINRVSRPERHACFIAGHGEFSITNKKDQGFYNFAEKLFANNIIPKEVLLNIDGIPSDCDLLIEAGPAQKLSNKEIDLIKKYLSDGGDALFLVENVIVSTPDKPLTPEEMDLKPSLNEILNDWGVKVANDVVVDLASHASGDVGSPATKNYMPHKAFVTGLDYTFYVRPRSISMIKDRKQSIKIAPLLTTASQEQSWGETDRYLNIKYDEGIDRAGPVPLAFIMYEPKMGDKKSETRIVVFTDADFLSNAFIDVYSNGQMGINAIQWVTESDYQEFVNPKKIQVPRLDLTSKQKRQVAVVLIFIPVLIGLGGLMFWLKRSA